MKNPFRSRIVAHPWMMEIPDIPEINELAFRRCLEAFQAVLNEHHSYGVLLHGEPGAGKTHLLARLRQHLQAKDFLGVFIYVRLQCGPGNFWRNFRSHLIRSLLQKAGHNRTQLERIYHRRLGTILREMGVRNGNSTNDKILQEAMDRLARDTDMSHNMAKAISCLMQRRFMRDAELWLKGQSVSEKAANNLQLVEPDETDDPEIASRDFILSFCRLAEPKPVVICFDQIEAMQRYSGDKEGLFVFGQAVRGLNDETRNTLTVTCVQTVFLPFMKEIIARQDYDAITGFLGSLNPLDRQEAMKLITGRIAAAGLTEQMAPMLVQLRQHVLDQTTHLHRTARNVLALCADYVDESQGWSSKSAKQSVYAFLEEESEQRMERELRRILPEHTDDIVREAIPLVIGLVAPKWIESGKSVAPDVDMILTTSSGIKVGLSLCNQTDMKRLSAKLRRLNEVAQNRLVDDLVVVRHPDLPISSGARKTRQYLKQLKKDHQVRILTPSTEALAALAALRTMIVEAQSGDLSIGNRSIDGPTVRNWIQNHISGSAREFVEELIEPHQTDTVFDEELVQDLKLLLKEHRVMGVETAAERLAQDQQVIVAHAMKYPDQFGFLAGPPAVIFQYISPIHSTVDSESE